MLPQTLQPKTSATAAKKSAATGRGDLLRALAAGVEHAPQALGFELDPRQAAPTQNTGDPQSEKPAKASNQEQAKQAAPLRTPLRMPRAYAIEQRVGEAIAPETPLEWHEMSEGEGDKYFKSTVPMPLVTSALWQSKTQVQQILDKALSPKVGRRIDWEQTTRRLAKAETLRQLPRQQHTATAADVHLLIQGSPDFAVFEGDAKVLVGHLLSLCGRSLQVWRLRRGALGAWEPIGAPSAKPPRHLHGCLLLVLSDAGAVSGELQTWQQAAQHWSHQGAQVHWLFPGGAHELPTQGFFKSSATVCVPGPHTPLGHDDALALLLQALSVALVIDAPLVRALRQQLLPWASPLLELQLWQHPDFWQEVPHRQWRVGRNVPHRQQLEQSTFWTRDRLLRLADVLLSRKKHLSQAVQNEELINLATLSSLSVDTQEWASECGIDDAIKRTDQMTGTLRQRLRTQGEQAAPSTWRAYVSARHQRTGDMLQGCFPDLHNKWATLHALVAIPAGQALLQTPPNSADLDDVAPRVNIAKLWLSQDSEGLWLEANFSTETHPTRALLSDFWFASGRWLRLERDGQVLRTWPLIDLRKPTLLMSHSDLTDAIQVVHEDGVHVSQVTGRASFQVIHEIRPLRRLPAIDNVTQSMENPVSTVQTPWGVMQIGVKRENSKDQWMLIAPDVYAPKGVSVWVDDKAVGMTIKLDVGEDLRLRYIPPGTFLMGSSFGVGHNDEQPQHAVTITEGYWLAETPCTQALWQAVMGYNPSQCNEGSEAFERPLEGVSYEDVQTFLKKLQTILPLGVLADLPSEAQWEYACRAGTQTAYWWGDEFDPAMANTNHEGSKDKAGKEGTSPVGLYPPNPWGLFDMHGNVWEWCSDSRRQYREQAKVDPKGVSDGIRALRGGSWVSYFTYARSAFRDHWPSIDEDWYYIGFRLLLRSSKSKEGVLA